MDETTEPLLWRLFVKLRECGFPLAPNDFEDLLLALRAGFGWSSPTALCALCCSLWAKSKQERETITDLFQQLGGAEWAWQLEETRQRAADAKTEPSALVLSDRTNTSTQTVGTQKAPELQQLSQEGVGRAPPLLGPLPLAPRQPLVFQPRYPVNLREIVQALRRLRRPIRSGPATELDIEATVKRRCRTGLATPAVLVPQRRNQTRLLVLVDRRGSMAPFHAFVEEFCRALKQAARFASAEIFYFHDVPAEGADAAVLSGLSDRTFPVLDAVLQDLEPLSEGTVYEDSALLVPVELSEVLAKHAVGANVMFLSDAGAARGRYDSWRLLDTVAFVKALRRHTPRYVWLNPCPAHRWTRSTAEQIARHVPMLPLDRRGLELAVEMLRGRPMDVERPV